MAEDTRQEWTPETYWNPGDDQQDWEDDGCSRLVDREYEEYLASTTFLGIGLLTLRIRRFFDNWEFNLMLRHKRLWRILCPKAAARYDAYDPFKDE